MQKVEDFKEIMAYGVMKTPALVIDEEVKVMGRVATVKDIVNQDMEGLGRGAALKCIQMIESKIITKTETTVGLELVIGGTCQKIDQ